VTLRSFPFRSFPFRSVPFLSGPFRSIAARAALGAAVVVAATATAFAQGTPSPQPGAVPAAQPAPSAAPGPSATEDPVVARVNGRDILRSQIVEMQQSLPAQFRDLPLKELFPILLRQLVDTRLVAEAARSARLDQDEQVKKRINTLTDRVLEQAYVEREVKKEVTDERLRSRYQAIAKEFKPTPQVRARHILVASEGAARAVIADLDKGGDFARIARDKSSDGAAQRGGDLGYFGQGDMVPAFAGAAFKLKPGEYTKAPVQTQFGWHVIRVEDQRTYAGPSFEEAREELHAAATQEAAEKVVETLRGTANIETFSLDGPDARPEIRLLPRPAR